jgi:predicted metal-dependent peptidase
MPRKAPPPPPTQAELDAARATAKKLIEKARAFIVLDHPFFATIMLKRPFVERLDVRTLAVTTSGTVYYNPLFVAQQSTDNMVWAICHEIMHYASGHGIRRQHRDPRKWNYAGDMWINDTLNKAQVGQKIEGCIDVPGSAERTCEEIYAAFPPDEDNGGGQGQGQGNGDGDGDGDGQPNPDPIGDDMEDDTPSESDKAEVDANRKIEVSEAAQVAKMKGNLPGVLQKFAEATVESKTPWFDVLERYMTEKTTVDQSWSRPNRRYVPDVYLPTNASEGAMGEIVIQVDISGSVSREEIRHYNGHMKRIVEQCKPNKVHVIYTDTEVQHHDEFDKPEDVQINFHSGGGTHMPAGMAYIQDKGIEPAVFVTLTDGYTGWDEEPPFPTVHCISGKDKDAPYGTNIHFDLNAE